jgi:hypothetical protein
LPAGYAERSSEEKMSTTKAKDIIFDQVQIEVTLGHNAIAVFIALSEHSQVLNALPFRQTLGSMQHHAFDAFILTLCKLYEKRSKRYPNYSIPTTLELLQENSSDLGPKIQNYVRLEEFIKTHVEPSLAVHDQRHIERIPGLVLEYFLQEHPRTPSQEGKELDIILDALKVLRDKRVAHNEDADLSSLNKTDLDGAIRLLAFAQTYVNLVGYGFFGFSKDGEVSAEGFAPSRSVVWPELNRMIGLLEQSD